MRITLKHTVPGIDKALWEKTTPRLYVPSLLLGAPNTYLTIRFSLGYVRCLIWLPLHSATKDKTHRQEIRGLTGRRKSTFTETGGRVGDLSQ